MTVTKIRDTTMGSMYVLYGTITIAAGDTYSTGGLTLNFAPIAKATRPPTWVQFDGNAGFVYDYNPGTNASNGKVKILTGAAAQAPLTELTAGAPPAGVQSDTIKFRAEFLGML